MTRRLGHLDDLLGRVPRGNHAPETATDPQFRLDREMHEVVRDRPLVRHIFAFDRAVGPPGLDPIGPLSLGHQDLHSSSLSKPLYIGMMPDAATGPVAAQMIERLTAALSPTRLELEDQSQQHIGHAGHDPRGESHFALVIESAAFAGLNRVERQRRVYAALGDLMHERVHALTILAKAPGEG